MENLPLYIPALFILATALTLFFLYKSAHHSKRLLIVSTAWLTVQAIIGLSGFYTVSTALPPRFVLALLPPVVVIIALFNTAKGKAFVDDLNPKWLTLLHVVRVPVEAVLLWLSFQQLVPELMTFEGRNFDVLSGLTAPFVFYYGYVKKRLHRNVLLAWNFSCLALLVNIVVIAVLSAPFPFQTLAFDQPNIAVLYFPFVWLPAFIVPAVLFSHLTCIRQWNAAMRRPSLQKKTVF